MHLMNCPVCGKRIPFNSPHCPECGFDLTEYAQEPSNKKPRKIKRIISIVALSMIVLVIIDIGINLWVNTGHKVEMPSVDTNNVSSIITPVPTSIMAVADTPVPTETPTPTPTATPSPTATPEPVDYTNPVGVYSGNDGNILVLNGDGLAYYYCIDIEFTELELPWKYEDGRLDVYFSKMHCDAYAIVEKDDFSEIILRADSQNWNAELFNRINVKPEDYIGRAVESYDPEVTVNSDGTMSYTLDGVTFKIPKQFRNPPNVTVLGNNATSFVDNDVDTDFISVLLFYRDKAPAEESFPNRFLENVEMEKQTDTTIAGRSAKTRVIRGSFNTGFPSMSGIRQVGTLTIITNPNEKSILYVLMLQTENRFFDNTEAFREILNSAIAL